MHSFLLLRLPAYPAKNALRPFALAAPVRVIGPVIWTTNINQRKTPHSNVTVPFTRAKNFVIMPIRTRLSRVDPRKSTMEMHFRTSFVRLIASFAANSQCDPCLAGVRMSR